MADEFDKLNELMAGLGVSIRTKPNELIAHFVLIHGGYGVGKTSILVQSANTVLIEAQDESSEALKRAGSIPEGLPVVTSTGFYNVIELLKAFTPKDGNPAPFKKVVIDGASGLARWSDLLTIQNKFGGDADKFIEFGGDKGEKMAVFYWMELMEAIQDLRAAGVTVYLIAHTVTKPIKNPDGSDYLKFLPSIGICKDRMNMTIAKADGVLFFDTVIETHHADKKTDKGAKAVGGTQRVIKTDLTASYEAKNRMGLPALIDLGGSALEGAKALHAAIQAGKKK